MSPLALATAVFLGSAAPAPLAGTLSGDSIVGTVTIVGRIGAVASTPLVAPITLTRK